MRSMMLAQEYITRGLSQFVGRAKLPSREEGGSESVLYATCLDATPSENCMTLVRSWVVS
jgi:hypothetical protein